MPGMILPALTREDALAPHVPWLGRDEMDNLSK